MTLDRNAAVATPLATASVAGEDMFRLGGTAVDAAIAANAVLAVAYPHMCSLGGDLFAVVRDPAGSTISVNGSGRSSSLSAQWGSHSEPDNWLRGRHTVTVPGTVGAWHELHTRFGRLSLPTVLSPAISVAREGFPVSSSLARSLRDHEELLRGDPGSRETFFRDGVLVAEGDMITQPALAETLEEITRDPRSFYVGAVAQRLLRGMQVLSIPMAASDFADYAPVVQAPLSRDVRVGARSYRIHTSPPNSQGLLLISALQDIHRSTSSPDPSNPRTAQAMARAAARAARWRNENLGDPERMTTSPADLLDGRERLLTNAQTQAQASGSGDTVAVVVSDTDGLSVSLIQSLYSAFGTGITERETGILLHNRGACFSTAEASVNSLVPGARPAHSLMPVLVERDGALEIVAGTMGGLGQPQIHTHLALRILGLSEPLEFAMNAPRWILDPPPSDGGAWQFAAESGVPAEVISALAADGFEQRAASDFEDTFGHAQVVQHVGTELRASSDPRADGVARVFALEGAESSDGTKNVHRYTEAD